MSTSFLYHAFGLSGYDYVRQEFARGNILLHAPPRASWFAVHAAEAVMLSTGAYRNDGCARCQLASNPSG